MKLLRWIIFLPVAAILIGLAQLIVALVAERMTFWVAGPLIVFFGVVIAAASFAPCRIAPDPKVGATILVTLFVLVELFALVSFLPKAPLFQAIARLYTDVVLVVGAVAGGMSRTD